MQPQLQGRQLRKETRRRKLKAHLKRWQRPPNSEPASGPAPDETQRLPSKGRSGRSRQHHSKAWQRLLKWRLLLLSLLLAAPR